MNSHGVIWGLVVGTCLFAVACGDDEQGPSKAGGGTAGAATSAGTGAGGEGGEGAEPATGVAGTGGAVNEAGSGGSAGSAGSAGTGGSSGEIKFESKPAGVELELDAASKAAGITLRSSSLIQDTGTSLGYTEWRAALHNGTDETQCFIEVNADFQDAAGTSIIKFHSYAYGGAYDTGTGLGLTVTCAAAGETVPIWSNNNPMKVLPIASTKKLVLEVKPMARPEAVLHPATPTVGPLTKTFTNLDWWVISGKATAKADVYNVKAAFWGKVGEFFVDDAAAFHSEDFLKGQIWDFETIAGIDSMELDEVVTYFSFIEGTEGAQLSRKLSPRDAQLVDVRRAASAEWEAADARRKTRHAKL